MSELSGWLYKLHLQHGSVGISGLALSLLCGFHTHFGQKLAVQDQQVQTEMWSIPTVSLSVKVKYVLDSGDDLWGHRSKLKPWMSHIPKESSKEFSSDVRWFVFQGHRLEVKLTTVSKSFRACEHRERFWNHCSLGFVFSAQKSQHPHASLKLVKLSVTTGILKIP